MTHEDYKKEIIEKYLELKKTGFFANKKEERRKNDEEFKAKYGISFFEKFGIESISLLKGKDLLYHLFQDKDDSTNSIGLTRALEYYMPDYGSFTGTDWSKSPASYSANKKYPEQGRLWRDFNGNAISEGEAIKIAEKTKEKLIQLYNYLKNGDLESFYQECPNDRYYRFYHKYLYMFYPDILTSYHSKDFAKNHKVKLNLHESQKLALEKYFWEIKKQFNLSDVYVDDLRLTIEELWGVGIAATTFDQMKPKQYRPTEICKQNSNKEQDMTKIPLNQILYGPPGTGKTYNTIIKAMDIINPKLVQRDKDGNVEKYNELKTEFDKLKQQGQIEFVTFHQSYSYEEFVEGIKPDISKWNDDGSDIKYVGKDGIFKNIAKKALFSHLNILASDDEKFKNIIKCFIDDNSEGSKFKTQYSEFEIVRYTQTAIIVEPCNGKTEYNLTFNNLEKLYRNKQDVKTRKDIEQILGWRGLSTYYLAILNKLKDYSEKNITNIQTNSNEDSIIIKSIDDYLQEYYEGNLTLKEEPKKYILIIDEINRGDVSKIFGELITLIEEDKRIGKEHQMTVTLPYSREPFGVPNNLYIIGTMNTADRSIALLDTALRRRFDFEEMMPKPELLRGKDIEGVDLEQLLTKINDRIKNEYDRDHQIGHSYLMEVENKEQLERAYKNRILPLLNEYFYNDIDSVAKVLNCKPDDISSKENWFNVLKEAQKPTKKDNEQ